MSMYVRHLQAVFGTSDSESEAKILKLICEGQGKGTNFRLKCPQDLYPLSVTNEAVSFYVYFRKYFRVHIVGSPVDAAEPYKLVYSAKYGDGDGTVNGESLAQCKKWSEQQQQRRKQPRIHYDVLAGVRHAAMVTGKRAQDKVIDILASINNA